MGLRPPRSGAGGTTWLSATRLVQLCAVAVRVVTQGPTLKRWRERERERGREGEREREREGGREGKREREGGGEGGKEAEKHSLFFPLKCGVTSNGYIYNIYIYINIFSYIQDCLRKLEYCDEVLYFL